MSFQNLIDIIQIDIEYSDIIDIYRNILNESTRNFDELINIYSSMPIFNDERRNALFENEPKGVSVKSLVKDTRVGINIKGECSICLQKFKPVSIVRTLSCNHPFHINCIDTWLSSNITCPHCRKEIKD